MAAGFGASPGAINNCQSKDNGHGPADQIKQLKKTNKSKDLQIVYYRGISKRKKSSFYSKKLQI